jgi:hypothetical protein
LEESVRRGIPGVTFRPGGLPVSGFLGRRCPGSLFLFVKALLHERLQKGLVADIPASGQCFQAPERKIVEADVDRLSTRTRTLLLGGLFLVFQEVFRYPMLL